MKQCWIQDLVDGQAVVDFFLLREFAQKEAKNGNLFAAMTLADKTGSITARQFGWDGSTLTPGSVLKIAANVETYNGSLQLKVSRLRVAEPVEIDRADYLPASRFDREEMAQELRQIWRGVVLSDPLYQLIHAAWAEVGPLLMGAPAAKAMHHAFLGGLLEHTLSLTKLARAVAGHYGAREDLLVAAALFHDIGKVWELEYTNSIDYTRRGRLVGHIAMGLQFIDRLADRTSVTGHADVELLEHIVASHHGQLEWGALKIPATREAILFHLMDMMDAKTALFDSTKFSESGWSAFSRGIGTELYCPAEG